MGKDEFQRRIETEQLFFVLHDQVVSPLRIRTMVCRLKHRLKELSSPTSIPVPFECYYAAEVKNAGFVERQLLEAFGDHRISLKREFFKVSPHRIKAALELVAVREITLENDPAEAEEVKNYMERRPPFRFTLARIPIGAELRFLKDDQIVCKVIDDRSVEFQGQVTSLSAAASELLAKFGRKSAQVQGPIYWLYEGETLEERRQRIEAEG
jgi:hypothetical protein